MILVLIKGIGDGLGLTCEVEEAKLVFHTVIDVGVTVGIDMHVVVVHGRAEVKLIIHTLE